MKNKKISFFLIAAILVIIILFGIIIYFLPSLQQERKNKSAVEPPTPIPAETISNTSTHEEADESIASGEATDSKEATDSEKALDSEEPGTDNPNEQITSGDTLITPSPLSEPSAIEPIVLAFAGDINLDEDSKPVARYDSQGIGILGCISEELVEEMSSADIMMLNNEFAYSLRGTEAIDKSYTFRAAPERVKILEEMGVDIVSLANNHALDFGEEALLDTFNTLEEADIDYVGAGINLDRAKAPIYYTIRDKKVAYLAASRVVFAMDWYATDTRPGMIGTYDPTLFLQSIREASENSNFVVVYVHWGVERTHYPVDYQKTLARQYIEAGADAVIGCHPHVLQGLEFYQGKPIVYSLGNYWFNNTKREAGLLKLILTDDAVKVQLIPTMGENTYTSGITDKDERNDYFRFMEGISFGVSFDEEGYAAELGPLPTQVP